VALLSRGEGAAREQVVRGADSRHRLAKSGRGPLPGNQGNDQFVSGRSMAANGQTYCPPAGRHLADWG
jgi:hypothetical protein